MWHGGVFQQLDNGGLCYINGQGRTFSVDPDELCFFYLVELVMKCARYDGRIQGFLYLVPGLSMVDGLRKVTDDESMREMIQVAEKHRGVEPTPSSIAAANTENDPINSYEWEDSRPDNPIPINDLIPDFSSDSDTADPSYNPQVDKGKGVSSQPFFREVFTDDSGEEDVLHAEPKPIKGEQHQLWAGSSAVKKVNFPPYINQLNSQLSSGMNSDSLLV
uniref:PB1-like domain-containing protein n=1 Tax=Chenopodium quinoa TaxID=63459 RepID=A0A803KQL0_CHEQI